MPRIHGTPQVGWWDGHANPTTGPTGTSTTWVGVRLQFAAAGRVFGVQWWDPTAGPSTQNLVIAIFGSEDPEYPDIIRAGALAMKDGQSAKWHRIWFQRPVQVDTSDTYHVAALYQGGGFFRTNNALTAAVTRNGIIFLNSFQTTSLNPYVSSIATNTNANAVDVLFQPD